MAEQSRFQRALNLAPTQATTGVSPTIGPFGELLVAEQHDDLAISFQYNFLNTDYDVQPPVVTGDGVVSVTNRMVTCSSAADGTAYVESKDPIRYLAGHTLYSEFTLRVTGDSGAVECGPVDAQDGFLVRYDIDNTQWSFGYRKSGVDYLDPFTMTTPVDPAALNVFRVLTGYLGSASGVLQRKQGDWRTQATSETEGVLEGTHVDNPVFPVSLKAVNGATGQSGSWSGGTFGQRNGAGSRAMAFPNVTLPTTGTAASQGTVTVAANSTVVLAVFRNKAEYKGVVNKVRARLTAYRFSVNIPASGSGDVFFQIVGVPTLTGTGTYTDISADNSIIEYNHTAGTGSSFTAVTGGTPIIHESYSYAGANKGGSGGGGVVNAEEIGAVARPGESFAVVARNYGAASVDVEVVFSMNWAELW